MKRRFTEEQIISIRRKAEVGAMPINAVQEAHPDRADVLPLAQHA